MLEADGAEDATGAVGLAETALATKALSAPRAKAATPAMIEDRKVPNVRRLWGVYYCGHIPLDFRHLWDRNGISNRLRRTSVNANARLS